MVEHRTIASAPLAIVSVPRERVSGAQRLMRIADVTISLLALIVLLPLILLIAATVLVIDPGPVLFRHKRIGRDARPFFCLKFRSMVVDAQARLDHLLQTDPDARMRWERDHKLADDPRITRIGKFLRASSLDELPQLINVLCGEMSLVGPRPIVESEVSRYGRYISDYYSATPGVTGLWQISGRSNTTYRRRVALDVAFARSQSVSLYFRILFMTVPAVVFARGSY